MINAYKQKEILTLICFRLSVIDHVHITEGGAKYVLQSFRKLVIAFDSLETVLELQTVQTIKTTLK
ncbi:hypothetical protein T01_11608 [Trichinella spiralis]|uniref:Uncharacterized protein n=1 Tax=Trichinella spiralis TaxID=6334 RepID=A0A0V1AYM3_TRISP|nr:hypothetical protein T01_11608 [Trichinella spiralis]